MIRYTAECMQCQSQNPAIKAHGPLLYDDKDERDDQAQDHANRTGHTLAIGWIDTNEPKGEKP